MGDPNQGGGGMRQVELTCSFNLFVQMLSYTAMKMPDAACYQPFDYKHENNFILVACFPPRKKYSYLFVRQFSISVMD
jgi:hypothetical protein